MGTEGKKRLSVTKSGTSSQRLRRQIILRLLIFWFPCTLSIKEHPSVHHPVSKSDSMGSSVCSTDSHTNPTPLTQLVSLAASSARHTSPPLPFLRAVPETCRNIQP